MRTFSATASLAVSLMFSAPALSEEFVYDFEEFTLGQTFTGVPGEFSVAKADSTPITIIDRTGTFVPEIEGLGGNTMWTGPNTGNFEFVFESPIDYFEIYVLDAEEGEIINVSVETNTGLIGTITLIGTGVGEWCGPGSSCGGPNRLIQVGSRGGATFESVLIRSSSGGPGPYDLLTFNTPPPQEVSIDIQGQNTERCRNQKAVKIYGAADFDVASIDISTLAFGEDGPDGYSPGCAQVYLNGDEYLDLACKFVPGTAVATLSGELTDGSAFEGSDTVCAAQ